MTSSHHLIFNSNIDQADRLTRRKVSSWPLRRFVVWEKDFLSVMEQSNLLEQAERLRAMVHGWIPRRRASVNTLRALADKLMEHHNNVCIAKVAGSSASVAGFAVAAVGFGLSFVTCGATLILSAVGLGVGAAGGLTNAGSMITEAYKQKDTFATAHKIIGDDLEAANAIKELLEDFGTEAHKSILGNGIKAGFSSAVILKNCVETGLKFGSRIAATAASEGGEAFVRGLSVAGRVAHFGGFAFSAILVPVDLYTLVTNSMEVDAARKGKKVEEPKAARKLRELADDLERNMPDESDLDRELDAFISNALFSAQTEMQEM